MDSEFLTHGDIMNFVTCAANKINKLDKCKRQQAYHLIHGKLEDTLENTIVDAYATQLRISIEF